MSASIYHFNNGVSAYRYYSLGQAKYFRSGQPYNLLNINKLPIKSKIALNYVLNVTD